jgi:acyl-CoA dehydrogenase
VIDRPLFDDSHDLFRRSVRHFIDTRILPHHDQWERDGIVSREVWREAGEAGLLLCAVPEEFGGAGGTFLHSTIVMEELSRAVATGPGFHLHSDIVAPYILHYGTEAQKMRYLPAMARGEMIGALAMSEPGTGSDVQNITTTAQRDGNGYSVRGSKIFITNGQLADIVVVAAKTDPAAAGARGISLVIVERGDAGFSRGRNLEKAGWHAQDTSELFFDDVHIPADRLLGEEGRGFRYLMQELAQERLLACLRGVAALESMFEATRTYCHDRRTFGQRLADHQTVRHKLAEIDTDATVARIFVDRLLAQHLDGALNAVDAAKGKYWITETVFRRLDDCMQLHGGYGYMREYPISRAWADNRVSRIAGGTSEIMKEIIGRALVEPSV